VRAGIRAERRDAPHTLAGERFWMTDWQLTAGIRHYDGTDN
jgi:hypothetical protein